MGDQQRYSQLELWGGIECSRVRIGDNYFDQIQQSQHDRCMEDLDRIAELGIKTIRYPALWEQAATDHSDSFDWSWADQRLKRLRQLRMRPVVGLVHHGSGPQHTHLLDKDFATGLARYAGALARRFPWVDAYTPVNEPLTTARFSALYGHWYPHARDGVSFARALLNQCRAIVLAMQAIREVRPDAQLIQTEDLGKTFSTPSLNYQAQFENERRWLTFDLLLGRVNQHHPMGQYFQWLGITKSELAWFQEHPCVPDLMGVNYYVTSERFLDDRLTLYDPACHGGNGQQVYVDVEAVRVLPKTAGPSELLQEAWSRYGHPLAVTEVHLGCTREEQLRWLWHIWGSAEDARKSGVDIRAVTVWSLLGAYDWNSLMTRPCGYYESGAFDVRGGRRPTAISVMTRELACGRSPASPWLQQPGWWERPERLLPTLANSTTTVAGQQPGPPLLITGASGTLGYAFARVCGGRALPYKLANRAEMDIADSQSVDRVIAQYQPWAVINAAGFVRVDTAEVEIEKCVRENELGVSVLARACAAADIPLVTFSSDLVFDGRQRTPYKESSEVNPLCIYGKTKAAAERQVATLHPRTLIVRTSAFFGPWDCRNFISEMLKTIAAGQDFFAVDDAIVSPTYVPDLVNICLDLLIDGERGIWHISNQAEITWVNFARRAAHLAGMEADRIHPRPLRHFGWAAPRPYYSALRSERGVTLADLDCALTRYLAEREEGQSLVAV
jgi:dTDP-4-dehydrorhamnose reductase